MAYGTALPCQWVPTSVIAQAQSQPDLGPTLGIERKTVPEADEDAGTLAMAAGHQALQRAALLSNDSVGAIFVGSESHPYAVKPTSVIVAQALGLSSELAAADLQFACKAGTQGLQIGLRYVQAEAVEYALAIGADTAQSRPGDVLEFSAAAGAAAFLTGSKNLVAQLIDTVSYATDTPDFWRRPGQPWPEHAGRFTAEPGYFHHVRAATELLLKKTKTSISDYTYCVFHTPNGKFPTQIAKELGCKPQQMEWSLPVKHMGNTYAAASLLALASVLDHAKNGETILLTSYGSGSGADSFAFSCTPLLEKKRQHWHDFLKEKIDQAEEISLAEYSSRRVHT